MLYNEKEQIIKNSTYHNFSVMTRGLKGSISSYWQNYIVVISGKIDNYNSNSIGSYIYFYKNMKDLMPHHYYYLNDCKIVSQTDL